jgi:hypothetical protein
MSQRSSLLVAGETGRAQQLLQQTLRELLLSVKPTHPISILDLSPEDGVAMQLAALSRLQARKTRIISYEWRGPKNRIRVPGIPEVLIEKGSLPGLPFSHGSFDYIVGIDVIFSLPAAAHTRALGEMSLVALRKVVLVEPQRPERDAGVQESQIRDASLQAGIHELNVEDHAGLLRLRF